MEYTLYFLVITLRAS